MNGWLVVGGCECVVRTGYCTFHEAIEAIGRWLRLEGW